MPSETYERLDRQWKSTCKILLKADAADLDKHAKWLSEYNERGSSKTTEQGEEIFFESDSYAPGSCRIDFGSVDFLKKYPPLKPSELADIDSIADAIRERAAYSGNILLGNTAFAEKSSNVYDSTYIYRAAVIANSSCVAYTTNSRFSKYVFGGDQIAESEYSIRGFVHRKAARTLETWQCDNVSDVYYSCFMQSCKECMFSFNLIGESFCIGNLKLPKEKYLEKKAIIIEQLAGELESKGRLPSLLDFVPKHAGRPDVKMGKPADPPLQDREVIEKEFRSTARTVLGISPDTMGKYSGWLLRHVRGIGRATSAISGKPLSVPLYSAFQAMPEGRLIGAEEAKEAGRQLRISNDEAETFSLGNAREKLGRIAYFCVEREIGNNTNNIDCPVQINSSGCYRIPNCVFTKDSAYSYWARNSEHCFGCSRVFDSAFCISCHNSMKLSRCFEMDCCRNCADSYFCHNCENVHDSMFCFNVKNLRYAIGNAEVGREAFERAKKLLLAEITGSLEKTHDYKRSIYNISGKGN